ncbi:MAG TPA: hypothetical protein VK815_02620 [Candidatus Acidoferrales bacterium]|jgi:uncharacterized delta-60 repeat protein|nr:hypothetical protein [Candidatus Acidoferrales bacterium]
MKKLLWIGVGMAVFFSLSGSGLCGPAGSLDLTFNPGTGPDGVVDAVALQPDGKILIGGYFTKVNNINRVQVARLNSDGSVDPTFDPGDGPNGEVDSFALQTDGQILIGGSFVVVDGLRRPSIARLRADGSLDATLNTDAGLSAGLISCVAVQTNGQILATGNLTAFFNNLSHAGIARFNTDGSVDTSFDPGTGADSPIYAMAIQPDGKILAGGGFASFNGTNRSCLVRLNPDGSIDTGFNPNPLVPSTSGIKCLAVQTNGQVLIGGIFVSLNGYTRHNLARLNADGSLDLGFNSPAAAAASDVEQMVLQSDGKILAVGFQSGTSNNIFRLNGDGSLDAGFTPVAVRINALQVKKLLLQSDGKLLAGGGFNGINGTNINNIARLNVDNPVSTTLNLLHPQTYFGMNLSGVVSNVYRIESTSIVNTQSLWTPLFNVTLQTNPQFILDTNPAVGQRFYRAVSLP